MTALWGPMGWMTLHSISVNYPESPTFADMQILDRFMNAFGESISCPHCKEDFAKMFPKYKNSHPEWNTSKYNLFLAIVRMHNTVNKKLDKPRARTVAAAIEMLRNATNITTPAEFRQRYIDYLIRNWSGYRHSSLGVIALNYARELNKINSEYWNLRESSYVDFPEADIYDVVMNYNTAKLTRPNMDMNKFVKGIFGRRK